MDSAVAQLAYSGEVDMHRGKVAIALARAKQRVMANKAVQQRNLERRIMIETRKGKMFTKRGGGPDPRTPLLDPPLEL